MAEQDNDRLEVNEELKNKLVAKEIVIADLKGVLNNLNLQIDELREEGASQHIKFSQCKNSWKIVKNMFLNCKINNKIIKIKKRFIK